MFSFKRNQNIISFCQSLFRRTYYSRIVAKGVRLGSLLNPPFFAKKENYLEASEIPDLRFVVDIFKYEPDKQIIQFSGWLYHSKLNIKLILVLDDNAILNTKAKFIRHDVRAEFSDIAENFKTGFAEEYRIPDSLLSVRGSSRLKLYASHGGNHQLLIEKDVFSGMYFPLLPESKLTQSNTFYFLVASSNISLGGFAGFKDKLGDFARGYCQLGFTAPVLYLRSTKGRACDWVFDAEYDESRRGSNKKQVIADSMRRILDMSIMLDLPCVIGLNGGIWSDASGTEVEWDLTDYLEEEPNYCQWNHRNEVLPDDYLKNLTGAEQSPELSRCLSLNAYNEQVRYYKKRNLQVAATYLQQFSQQHPKLYLGSNLDPDCYHNPFFEGEQFYDYNPDTLQQFRDWLRLEGVYKKEMAKTVTHKVWTLDALNVYAGTQFSTWDEVVPPRNFQKITEVQYDKLYKLWDWFKRHLVHEHYSDLADWMHQVDIPTSKIFSSQGFTAPRIPINPFALELDSEVKNYDSGGMSLAGSKPRQGHIGAILYGESARNNIRTENELPFFTNILLHDKNWAVVEFNPADLRDDAKKVPSYKFSYQCLREIFNHRARFISMMAWNGNSGYDQDKDFFNSHMALRNTPCEKAVMDFMLLHSDIARGEICYTFGTKQYADDDGWIGEKVNFSPTVNGLVLRPKSNAFTLLSPAYIPLSPQHSILCLEYKAIFESTVEIESVRYNISVYYAGEWHNLNCDSFGVEFDELRQSVSVKVSWENKITNQLVEKLKIECYSEKMPVSLTLLRLIIR